MNSLSIQILLVEDHPGDARLIHDLLSEARAALGFDFNLIRAERLAAGIEQLASQPFDIVLLDLALPDSEGLQSVPHIQAIAPHVPVIILTALDDEAEAIEAVRLGAQDYVVKGSVDSRALARAIRYAIERGKAEAETRRLRAFNENIVQSVIEGILLEDQSGHITFVNPAAATLLGYAVEELIGRHWTAIVPSEHIPEITSELSQRPHGVSSRYEATLLSKSGQTVPVIVSARPVTHDGRFAGVLSVFTDISERKRMEEELRNLSLRDELTSLYNRRGFLVLAGEHLKMARRTRKALSVLFADLDGLKAINDTLGHARGDQALVEIARILREVFRGSDIIARLGGDEFAILPVDAAVAHVNGPVERLQARLNLRNARGDQPYQLSISTGIASCNPDTGGPCTVEAMLEQADAAMYERKRLKHAARE